MLATGTKYVGRKIEPFNSQSSLSSIVTRVSILAISIVNRVESLNLSHNSPSSYNSPSWRAPGSSHLRDCISPQVTIRLKRAHHQVNVGADQPALISQLSACSSGFPLAACSTGFPLEVSAPAGVELLAKAESKIPPFGHKPVILRRFPPNLFHYS